MKQAVYCLSCGLRQLLTTGPCKKCGGITAEYADGPVPYEDEEQVKPPGRNDPCPCLSGRKSKRCCWR